MARRRRGQFPKPKKENGQWKIRYWTDQAQADGSIRRVRKTKCLGKLSEITSREAQKAAQRFLQPINDVVEGIEHSEKTVSQLIAQWQVAVKPNLKPSTQASYEWGFKRINRVFGRFAVADIERADVQAFLTEARKQLAPESIHDLHARLSGLFSTAENWGWIPRGTNPAKGKLYLPERIPARRKRILTPEQFQNLLMALPQPYNTALMLAGMAGLRKGEIAALRWNDIQPRAVIVDEAVYRGRLGTPKTPRSRRRVAIGPALEKALEDCRKRAKFTGSEDFVFGIRTNTPIDLRDVVARHVKPACVKLGIPLVSWHDLRHTYTTWGRKAGVKAETMRDQLGHVSVQITLDVYSHVDDNQADAGLIESYALPDYGTSNGTPASIATIPNQLKRMVGALGFEPRASCSRSRRATKLRYAPTA